MSRRNSDSPNWGGRRPGAGRKNRQRLTLSKEAAKTLYVLTAHKRALLDKPDLTEEDVVTSLVEEAWHEIDEFYQEKAEEAQEYVI